MGTERYQYSRYNRTYKSLYWLSGVISSIMVVDFDTALESAVAWNHTLMHAPPGMIPVPSYAVFCSAVGAASAIIFTAIGAAYGTYKSGCGIGNVAVHYPDFFMKSIVPVVMAGILAIYGMVVSILIIQDIPSIESYALTMKQRNIFVGKGIKHLASGLSVGMSCMMAGYAVGDVGDAGVRSTAQQPKFFVGMILILIFAGVPGLYGLIVALAMMYA